MFSWDRLEYPFADLLSLQDMELLTGVMPQHFPGSIRFNQLLRQINRDIGLLHLEGSLLGFLDEEDRRATRVVSPYGRTVRESYSTKLCFLRVEIAPRPMAHG